MQFDNPSRIYSISFIPRAKALSRKGPELSLIIASRDEPLLAAEVQGLERLRGSVAAPYLDADEAFVWPGVGQLELALTRSVKRFGYRRCGYLRERDEDLELRFPLVRAHLPETTLTLAVILELLNGLPEPLEPRNRQQAFQLSTSASRRGHYAHAVHGWAFPPTRRWLVAHSGEPLPGRIVSAMQEAWRALAPEETRKYAKECWATVDDGRFGFGCFGNACDLSIYPDQAWGRDTEHPCELSCHNLDASFQQLTLLAGFAAMAELIEQETN